ncbi:hypothetical protein BKA59DRAFT_533919 [Fusarium tricinctum]|uniref:SRR1-like domain-containing protein n=1 Tax=Fusarium tricinctum TaxID=61284 RepID=A0A8K0W7G6_9HYPO|nr:hypothetical protein BKA59DRAFT_533919 [Fusarium tricinctum]
MSNSNDSPEWTQVTRKSRKSNKHSKSKSSSHINSRSVGPQTENLRDPSELEKDYKHYRSHWEAGVPCSQLREFIKAKAANLKDTNRAVNFGTGSFDPPTEGVDPKRAAFQQLAAFEIVVEELEEISGNKIETFFQDPVFNESDKKFLTNHGHTVVEDPAGCELVNPNTFFFGVHLYKPVYNVALAKHLPVLFIGTGWAAWDDMFAAEGVENMERMHKSYEICDFPQNEARADFDPSFSTTVIYWKPLSEEETEEEKGKGKEREKEIVDDKEVVEKKSEKKEDEDEDEDELSKKLESTTIS